MTDAGQGGWSYAGRRVVVTGCCSGIGQRLAALLGQRGADVVGMDIAGDSEFAGQFIQVDLGDSASVTTAASLAAEHRVDALFNVAGISGTAGARRVIGVNFVGMRELTERLVSTMAAGAAIVNTASTAATRYAERLELVSGLLNTATREEAMAWCDERAAELGTGYAVSKDAVVWYTKQRAVELAPRGIRVNAVAPGVTETPILAASIAARGADFLDAIPKPLGRMSQPDEQAAVLAFLGSGDASYVTGQVIWVDGGYTAGISVGNFPDVTGSVS